MGPNTDGRNEREPSEWKGAEAGGVGGLAAGSRAADRIGGLARLGALYRSAREVTHG